MKWGHKAFFLLTAIFLLAMGMSAASVPASDPAVPYEITIEGTAEGDLLEEIQAVSDTLAFKDRPPASLILLQRRVEKDSESFLQLLRSRGHYAGRVETRINSESHPLQVTFRIDPGPVYLLQGVDLRFSIEGDSVRPEMPSAEDIGLVSGRPFKTEALLEGQKELLRKLGGKGFPFARVDERKVIVDHALRSVSVTLRVEPGPEAQFGPVLITGLKSTEEAFVRKRIPWREGDRFNGELLGELQKGLLTTGLFSTVGVTQGREPDHTGRVPVTVVVTERKHRSVSAGVSYRTDEGPGMKFAWEDRNLMGSAERLGLAAAISELTYSAEGGFRKPHFLADDQSFTYTMRLAEDKPDAYTSRNVANTAMLDRDLSKTLKAGAGIGFKQARITQLGETENFSLVSLPMQMGWDRSDDLLDPTRGGRMVLRVVPYYDLEEDHIHFVKAGLRYGHYLRILERPSSVLAGRVNMGILSGEDRMAIPADERFYAGGGGSIRGYAYQSVSPRVADTPVGGKSLLEMSLEARMRITEHVGLACFLDGGGAFRGAMPDSDERLLWGSGLGIRYFTPIGPFRFDVAVPLSRRDGLDDAFQVYISLGQAF